MNRPALIDKLCQPDKWLFKKELIPLENLAGPGLKVISDKLNVDFSTMPEDKMRQIVLGMILTGGGLQVDPSGKIYFDAQSMDTSVFEALMKKLRLPLWLPANTDFYVDKSHANASDTLDEGRGLSEAKPFKTIQACVNYICNNFNVGPYTAYINVSNEVYQENLALPGFNRTSGKIVMRSTDAASGYVRLAGDFSTNRLYQVSCTAGLWELIRPKVSGSFNYDTSSYNDTAPYVQYVGFYSYGGDLTVVGPYFDMTLSGTLANELRFYGFYAEENKLSIKPDPDTDTRVYMQDSVTVPNRSKTAFLSVGQNSILNFAHDNEAAGKGLSLMMNGDFDIVAYAMSKGSISYASAKDNCLTAKIGSGKAVTGKRYACIDGGTINVRGRGPNIFPGNAEGTVEADTYSWYK